MQLLDSLVDMVQSFFAFLAPLESSGASDLRLALRLRLRARLRFKASSLFSLRSKAQALQTCASRFAFGFALVSGSKLLRFSRSARKLRCFRPAPRASPSASRSSPVQLVHSISEKVTRHDRDLANQMKRSSTSVALNGSEGLLARAGKRTTRLEDAINSGRETVMALRLAKACGYAPSSDADAGMLALDRILAILWTLAYRK